MPHQPTELLPYADAFRVLAVLALLGIPIALLIKPGKKR